MVGAASTKRRRRRSSARGKRDEFWNMREKKASVEHIEFLFQP